MKKWIVFSWVLTSCCFAVSPTTNTVEQVVLGKETVSTVSTTGNVTLDGTTITDTLNVAGNLRAAHATIGRLEVVGHTALKEVLVNGEANLTGSVKIAHSEFMGPTRITFSQIFLADSTFDSLPIGKSEEGSETVYMSNTVIKGDLVFESGNGKILKKAGSKIEGDVKGAKFNL